MIKKYLFFFFVTFFPISTYGYIPRSGFQIERISKRHSDFEALIVDSEIIFYEDGDPTSVVLHERSIVEYRSRRFQSVAMTVSGRKVFEIIRNLGNQSTHIPALMSLLFENEPKSLKLTLIGLGIPILIDAELDHIKSEEDRRLAEKTTVRRLNDRLFWVIGNENQLWIEKDTFLPFKMNWTDPGTQAAMQVEFERYGFSGGYPYPAKIWLKKNEKVLLEIRTKNLKTNPNALKFLPKPLNGYSSYGRKLGDRYKKLIKLYYRILR